VDVPIYVKSVHDNIKNMIGFYNPGSGNMQRLGKSTNKFTQEA